jgi:hypothetical protein
MMHGLGHRRAVGWRQDVEIFGFLHEHGAGADPADGWVGAILVMASDMSKAITGRVLIVDNSGLM